MVRKVIDGIINALLIILLAIGTLFAILCLACLLIFLTPFIFVVGLLELGSIVIGSIKNIKNANKGK